MLASSLPQSQQSQLPQQSQQPAQKQENAFRYYKNKTSTYKPIDDGFITTSGNPKLGLKYGNFYSNPATINK
jgi:hypothetical protein